MAAMVPPPEHHHKKPVTAPPEAAPKRTGVTDFLKGRLPPTDGKFDLRFADDDTDKDDGHDQDKDMPEDASYTIALSRNVCTRRPIMMRPLVLAPLVTAAKSTRRWVSPAD